MTLVESTLECWPMKSTASPISRDVPGKRSPDVAQLTVRFPKEWLPRLDALAAKMAPAGLEFSRSDVLRVVIARGLDEVEREQGIAKRSSK